MSWAPQERSCLSGERGAVSGWHTAPFLRCPVAFPLTQGRAGRRLPPTLLTGCHPGGLPLGSLGWEWVAFSGACAFRNTSFCGRGGLSQALWIRGSQIPLSGSSQIETLLSQHAASKFAKKREKVSIELTHWLLNALASMCHPSFL